MGAAMEAVQRETVTQATAVRAPARAPRWVMPTLKVALVLTDSAVAAVSFIVAFMLRESAPVFATPGWIGSAWSARFAPYAALLPFVIIIRLLSLKYCNLYRLRGEFSF
ncbi:MAG TPA: hypothetical protein VIK24_01695, partial [Pyrinomonadaceae bacterium]